MKKLSNKHVTSYHIPHYGQYSCIFSLISFLVQKIRDFFSQALVLGIFKIAPRLRDLHVSTWQWVKVLNVFNTLTLIQIFWKMKTFFKKLGYRFLVETIKIENTSFPFKTALSEANVKTNRVATIKWTYHKKWSLTSNYFMFFEKISVLEPLKKS